MFQLPNSKSQKNLKKRIKLTNAQKIQKYFRTQEGNIIDFEEHPYLVQIYNEDSPYLVLGTSRQTGKTTFEAADLLGKALGASHTSILFATASEKQLSDVRDKKIRGQFAINPELRAAAFVGKTVNNKDKMLFSNQSTINFHAIAQSAETVRGLTAQTIYIDEVQSIPRENISVVRACSRTFKDAAKIVFTGTFMEEDNTLNQLYLDTCQNEWIIGCIACGKDNSPLGMQHFDLERPYLFCEHCKEPMSAKNGDWVPQNPSNLKVGYRLTSLMTPECTWRDGSHQGLHDLYESEPPDKFLNESMGLPSVRGTALIMREELANLCSSDPMCSPESVHGYITGRPSVAAIDWAPNKAAGSASHTMITFAQLERDHIKFLYAKRFTGPKYDNSAGPDLILDEICELVRAFNSDYVFCDYGMGHDENSRLKLRLGNIVKEMHYHAGTTPVKWDGQVQRFKISKTASLDKVFLYLRTERYSFPREQDFECYYEDILNVYTEYDEDRRSKRYVKGGKGPDDFLQLINFCTIGIMQMFGYPQTWLV